MKKQIFLISSSRYQGGKFWAHCIHQLGYFLGKPEKGKNKILFIPYADPDKDYDGYTTLVSETIKRFGYEVVGIHTYPMLEGQRHPAFKDDSISAVIVGGGNTWLLSDIIANVEILSLIETKVKYQGWKYIGASAGTIMACKSILTTNDMPPIRTGLSEGIGLIPFHINPHYVPGPLVAKHMGETREERIRQVILYNPSWQVVGLPEGCWIEGNDEEYILRGIGEACIFRKDGNNSIWLPNEPFDEKGML
jgi:dipeptidase E